MEPSKAPPPSSPGGLQVPGQPPSSPQPGDGPRRALPKYTTIDLENELPELYNTSLNPNIHDPDLTMFYNQNGPPFYNYKSRSPPPSYPNSLQRNSPSPSPGPLKEGKYTSRNDRYKKMLIAFFVVFVVFPFLLLLLSILLPAVQRSMQTRVIQ